MEKIKIYEITVKREKDVTLPTMRDGDVYVVKLDKGIQSIKVNGVTLEQGNLATCMRLDGKTTIEIRRHYAESYPISL